MSKVLEINNDNFNEEVNENKDTLIIDFWAEWCGPCKLLSPIIEELSKEFEGKIYFAKVNLDNNQDLAMKFSIRSIPTLLLFKKGQLKDTKVGLLSKSDLKDWILSVD